MRILADLPETDITWLDQRAAELGTSRAALLRRAVRAFRDAERDWLEHGFGLWTRYGKGIDGGAFEAEVRAHWVRPQDVPGDGDRTAQG
ncbi:MAG: CopG family transcriptional regulator [Pseudomonadota bacterium]